MRALPHTPAASAGQGAAAEMLEASEGKSASAGCGLPSTMLSGLTGVSSRGESCGWAQKDGLLK